ncbi:hypothetical protein, conserved [Eimeria praecox]|uniref:Uncharacterized protein n=1 Tax=Eimeria praecox TaxID=51316 RepID=U6GFG0_9EIME|nr:hypothetical protein, conserved [Eimeria praecox]
MSFISAVTLRRLVAALRSLGLSCVFPIGGQGSRKEFILTTLLKLQYLVEPLQYASERQGGERQPELSQTGETMMPSDLGERVAVSAVREAKTPKDQLKLLKRLTAFMLQRVGVALELQALFRADADAVNELLCLAETLADAARQAPQGQANNLAKKTAVYLQVENEEEKGFGREHPFEIPQALRSKDAIQTVQTQVEKVLSSVQNFYGEDQTGERRKTGEFLQAVLALEGSSGSSNAAAAPTSAARGSSGSNSALLLEQLDRSGRALADVERNNEALAFQVQELKEKIGGAERNADRLGKQLLLLGASQNSVLAAPEEQQQRDMQEQLRQLYIQYARRCAVCDTLTASVEAIAGHAEAEAARNRLRLQEARQQLRLEHAATASATDSQTNCIDTLCGGMSEDMGLTLASSEQLCTEGSELDLAGL